MNALRERFAQLARRLGAANDPHPAAAAVLDAYGEAGRAYHGIVHLADCLARLDETPVQAPERDRVEAALWYHDAVYDSRANDNEERSAVRARRALTDLGITAVVADDVARLVRLTDHQALPQDSAGRLVCDIDLSILGRPRAEFDAYDAAIRAEYAWVPDAVYRASRRQVLGALLARDTIYGTEAFRRRYEVQARDNLRRAMSRLESGGT